MKHFLKKIDDMTPEEVHREATMHLRALNQHLTPEQWQLARDHADNMLTAKGHKPLPDTISEMELPQIGFLGLSAAMIKEANKRKPKP